MIKNKDDKKNNVQKQSAQTEDENFEEKKRAAYAQMGRLGGLVRAKQLAEQGFKPKSKENLSKKEKTKKADIKT